jgi:Na+-driven multidrug efflux pump
MVLGVVMTMLNLILNIVFINGIGPIPPFGTAGAAIGTSIATGIIGLYMIFKMWNGGWVVCFRQGVDWRPNWSVIRSLFKFGIPSGFEGIAVSIGGVIMLSFIDKLVQSAAAQAAYVISYSQLFSLVTFASIGLMSAASTVAGQNLGAGYHDRAHAAVSTAARIGLAGSAFVGIFFFFFPRQLLAIFGMNEGDAADIGVQLLQVLSISGLFVSTASAYIGGLRGTGDTKGALYISFISQVVIPVSICFVIHRFGTLEPIHIWLAILTGQIANCGLSVFRFLQGKWRNIPIDTYSPSA